MSAELCQPDKKAWFASVGALKAGICLSAAFAAGKAQVAEYAPAAGKAQVVEFAPAAGT